MTAVRPLRHPPPSRADLDRNDCDPVFVPALFVAPQPSRHRRSPP
jgi:hypothetical protein